MPKSDLSLEAINEDELSTVRIKLETGDERELRVSRQEAETLAKRGTTISHSLVRAGRSLSRPLGWLLALIIGSLLIPAVTKQWTDRPKELELKNSLVTQITEASTNTVVTHRFIAGDVLPESRLVTYYYTTWQSAKSSEKEAAREKYLAAIESSKRAEQKAWNETYSLWQTKKASIGGQLDAYFPSTTLASDWSSYAGAVTSFEQLGATSCGDYRKRLITDLQTYFDGSTTIKWSELERPTADARCEGDFLLAYQGVYFSLGEEVLKKRDEILRGILSAPASGYSSGWRDLVNDLI
jgi:hypothetical protein